MFEDGLHSWSPLVPEASCDSDDGVGCTVSVLEDVGIEEVDAWCTCIVGEVDESNLVYDLRGHVME